jgi:hypothetical protein
MKKARGSTSNLYAIVIKRVRSGATGGDPLSARRSEKI